MTEEQGAGSRLARRLNAVLDQRGARWAAFFFSSRAVRPRVMVRVVARVTGKTVADIDVVVLEWVGKVGAERRGAAQEWVGKGLFVQPLLYAGASEAMATTREVVGSVLPKKP